MREATNESRVVDEFKSLPIGKPIGNQFYFLIYSEAKLQVFW